MAEYLDKNAIIPWLGGKSPIKDKLIALMPETRVYVEPFGGAANVILSKGPSPVDVYNDMNPYLVSLFRTVKDYNKLQEFIDHIQRQQYSRDAKKIARARLFSDKPLSEMEMAVNFYVAQHQGFSGTGSFEKGDSWGISLDTSIPRKWVRGDYALLDFHERLKNVIVEHMDAVEVIKKYQSKDALIYLDPPYVPSTRSTSGTAQYDVDYTYEQHEELLSVLLKCPSQIIISGYPNELYDDTLLSKGWEKRSWKVTNSAVVRTRSQSSKVGQLKGGQEECIWISPNTMLMQSELEFDEVMGM